MNYVDNILQCLIFFIISNFYNLLKLNILLQGLNHEMLNLLRNMVTDEMLSEFHLHQIISKYIS